MWNNIACLALYAVFLFLFFYLMFQQVDPEVFAALPRELQEELRSAYKQRENTQAQGIAS